MDHLGAGVVVVDSLSLVSDVVPAMVLDASAVEMNRSEPPHVANHSFSLRLSRDSVTYFFRSCTASLQPLLGLLGLLLKGRPT